MHAHALIMNGSRMGKSCLIFLSCMIMHDDEAFEQNRIMSDRIGQNVLVYRISGVIMAIHCEPPCPSVNHRVPA